MIAGNIFRWIGDLFEVLFIPFEWIRLSLAKMNHGWWVSNIVNWVFIIVLLFLFAYWMKECSRFLREGTEDRVE